VLAVVIEGKGLCTTFTLFVTDPGANRVHISPIVLYLRMNVGISIDLRGGSLKDSCFKPFSESQHID
jgi:hypothetical protein